ncbi:MAG: hypothetical protein ACREX8_03115, partial [Gammaproteobacteria bacterium]
VQGIEGGAELRGLRRGEVVGLALERRRAEQGDGRRVAPVALVDADDLPPADDGRTRISLMAMRVPLCPEEHDDDVDFW